MRIYVIQISDLSSALQVSWPSLTCPSSNSSVFWSREWKKHGTCSYSELDQHAYFQAALKLKQKVNLLKILQKEGMRMIIYIRNPLYTIGKL